MAHLLKEGVSLGTDDGLLLKKGVSLGTDDGYWSTMHLYAIMFQEILFFFLEAKCITMSCPSPSDLMHQVKIQPGSAALFIIIISKTLNRTLVPDTKCKLIQNPTILYIPHILESRSEITWITKQKHIMKFFY